MLASLSFASCSSSEKQPEKEVSPPLKTSPTRVREAQELLSRCRLIEPRISGCDRLQAVVTRDDGVPPSLDTKPKTASVAVAEPLSPRGASLQSPVERAKHARIVLAELTTVATSAMRELENSEPATRDAIVARLAMQIEHACMELLIVANQLPPSTRSSLRSQANDGANTVLLVKTWIRSRRPNAAMNLAIDASVKQLDLALVQLGTETVGQRPSPALVNREADEADMEVSQAKLESSNLEYAISAELDYRRALANIR